MEGKAVVQHRGAVSPLPHDACAAILYMLFDSKMGVSYAVIHAEAIWKSFWPNSLPCVVEA